jgi:hypothetical protein
MGHHSLNIVTPPAALLSIEDHISYRITGSPEASKAIVLIK